MKKIIAIIIICASIISCNSNDTSHAGVVDTAKATVDTPKAVIVDSSETSTDSAGSKKDSRR